MKEKILSILFMVILCVIILFTLEHKHGFLKPKSSNNLETIIKPTKITEQQKQEIQKVAYVEEIKEVIETDELNNEMLEQEDTLIGTSEFGSKDALILHKISIAEAGIKDVESMALIMLVVLNRTHSDDFPNSIEEVVFQNVDGVAQFTPTVDGNYNNAQPNEKSKEAMKLVLDGWDESQGALYFEACKGESWHSRNLNLLFEKDGIRYYKSE